jgi:hypothetical protein
MSIWMKNYEVYFAPANIDTDFYPLVGFQVELLSIIGYNPIGAGIPQCFSDGILVAISPHDCVERPTPVAGVVHIGLGESCEVSPYMRKLREVVSIQP